MQELTSNLEILSMSEKRQPMSKNLYSQCDKESNLPIFAIKKDLILAYTENQILIVVGETGCGKTTKLTQFIAEAKSNDVPTFRSRIGCTQPRCVAAVSVATRVAEEVGCLLGVEVGYAIRFEDCTSNKTKIKYMTDGILLREALRDPKMQAYHTIIIDEAHERTISTDILLGLLKKAALIRPKLKIIITSASMNATKFSKYFDHAPILTIPGRTHPVDIQYALNPVDLETYVKASVETVLQIHYFEEAGDILLFLTGQAEIEWACAALSRHVVNDSNTEKLLVLPVYSFLPLESLTRIFDPTPAGFRKVAIATNIAETSLTINGIRYVIDPGYFKQNGFKVLESDPSIGKNTLEVLPISKAQATQRCGRAGRTGPGKCLRLYSKSTYETLMNDIQTPEIQRTDLTSMVLQLKAIGITNIVGFSFVDPPPLQNIVLAIKSLNWLEVLDKEGQLRPIGYEMAAFPIEPSLARLLIKSVESRCSEEILTIVAMLSVQNLFYEPKDELADIALEKKIKFNRPEGDLLTLLNVYCEWKQNRFSDSWCIENYINLRSIKRALYIRRQLHNIMTRLNLELSSLLESKTETEQKNVLEEIQKVICSGFYRNVARKVPDKDYYRMLNGSIEVYLFPTSSLVKIKPEWIVFNEIVETTKVYIKDVTKIQYEWLLEWLDANDLFFFKQLNKKKKKEPKHRNGYRNKKISSNLIVT